MKKKKGEKEQKEKREKRKNVKKKVEHANYNSEKKRLYDKQTLTPTVFLVG